MATVMRYFCLHFTSVQLSRYVCSYTPFFCKDVVFPAQAEYSYFSADFRLKILLYYSYIITYGIFVLLPPQGFGPEAKTRGGINRTPRV